MYCLATCWIVDDERQDWYQGDIVATSHSAWNQEASCSVELSSEPMMHVRIKIYHIDVHVCVAHVMLRNFKYRRPNYRLDKNATAH